MIKFGVLCRLSNSLRSECLKHIEKDWITVWCAKEEIYIKKPYYFTISKDADPVTAS